MIRSSSFLMLLLVLASLAYSCSRPPLPVRAPAGQALNTGRVGSAARHLLTDSPFTSVLVEIQYMERFEPDPKAVSNLIRFIERFAHKPDGVRVVQQVIPSAADTLYSLEEVMALEKQHRKFYNEGSQLALYLLYTNGVFVQTEMLGHAYSATSAAIFGKNVIENSNAVTRPSRTNLETKVAEHEIAHLMGLVNVGTPLQSDHKDNSHGKHCLNRKCLMYYITDTEESPNLVYARKPLPTLCADCRADLRAHGGK
ncbi:hypothetical protein EPD60_11270 [Flaviaesturariibacter flavus]|uniref:Peptidase n=1 Tax=Flaviaesturariibacter flavus TaxID=2502780 RepID=A0A4R1BC03_9BACT|nr:hypothetical protein [Flaviaesturariibacter flavus]TCJ14556.1 hypothetical protein EPD60_11270 [Flaviaesturariibacter flavus]